MIWFGKIERKLAKLSMTFTLLTVLPLNYFMVLSLRVSGLLLLVLHLDVFVQQLSVLYQ